ncbi:hypothetical protein WBP07_02425 [Novosphingobium sp. BL-8A]|uniref:hypothetical protein n=1 Tax=Novosphingobium sp. BL-8A TaxID=3127639 RepID=UPI003756CA0C
MTQTRFSARTAALAGASGPALMLAALMPHAAAAQSFQGTGTITSGSGSIETGTGTTLVQVGSTETVIDWVATDPGAGTSVNFQPAGTTASFTTGSGFSGSDYTVLNRIVTQDTLGTPTNSSVQFNGTVQSDLFGGTGGNIWFYSPNGIIVGATAQFSVGGLVLTTDPIDTAGGLYGANGEIRFTAPSSGAAMVSIANGAQLTASLNPQAPTNGSYIAIVSPRIEQGGTVRADGPIAYVAATAADITMNAGMFDIAVTSGTDDPNGIVHTGSTGGSSSAGAADPRVIRMVAVSKNDGLTMLLSGNIGYDAAASATDDGNAVMLTAGHAVDGVDAGDPLTQPGNITIGDAHFTSATTANATGTIAVAPTGQTVFDAPVVLNAINEVRLDALAGASILANDPNGGVALSANAGYGEHGGTVAINIGAGSAFTATGGVELTAMGDGGSVNAASINAIGGAVSILNTGGAFAASDVAIDVGANAGTGNPDGGTAKGGTITIATDGAFTTDSLTMYANAYGGNTDYPGGIGGSATGGTIQLTLSGDAVLPASFISPSATGNGGSGYTRGGDGHGGTVAITVGADASLGNATSLYLYAGGIGGDDSSGSGTGGDGYGGSASLTGLGGTLNLQYLGLNASGRGADSSAQAGSGFGGTATVSLTGGTYDWYGIDIAADSFAGEGSYGSGGGGNAAGSLTGGANLVLDGVTVTLASEVYVTADAVGAVNGPSGSFASAGHAGLSLTGGSSLTAEGSVTVSASADLNAEGFASDPLRTPSLNGGEAVLAIDGSSLDSSDVSVRANAIGMGALQDAGTMTGGSARLTMANGASLQVRANSSYGYAGALSVDASASGNFMGFIDGVFRTEDMGVGASAIGGTALLDLAGGTIATDSTASIDASGTGGPAGTGTGGNGTGGSAALAIANGTMSSNSMLSVTANGIGGSNRIGFDTGNATGGLASIDVGNGGALNVYASLLTVSALARAPDVEIDTSVPSGIGGSATGGTARLVSSGGTIFAEGDAQVLASGTGGLSVEATGGTGTGGSATLAGTGGGTITVSGAANVLATGTGGDSSGTSGFGGNATGGSALVDQSGSGLLHIRGDLTLGAGATGGLTSADAPALGTATGGTASLLSRSGTLLIDGNAALNASAISNGSTQPPAPATVAGLVELGSLGATSGGTLTIGGILDARALGDLARADGLGFRGAAAGSTISVGGQTAISATGNIDFAMTGTGSLDSTGTLVVTSMQGRVTGTGVLSSAGAVSISAPQGIALTRLSSGDTTLLQSLGAISITDLLSVGDVTVSGLSVDIGSTGSLSFADADATGGNLSLATTGDLTVATVDATGAVTLSSSAGQIRSNDAVNGSSVTYSAGTDIATAAPVTAIGNLTMTALGGISTGAALSGGDVSLTARNGDITLGDTVQAGRALTVNGGSNVTTLAALTAGSGMTISAMGDLTVGADLTAADTLGLTSGGQLSLDGAASGSSIALSAGTNIVTSTPITATGNLTMTALGGISTGAALSGGDVSLTARNGDIMLGDTVQAGGALTVNGGADVTTLAALTAGSGMTISAAGDLSVGADLTGRAAVGLAAGGTLAVQGVVAGTSISASSADIVIGRGGQIGRRDLTQTVSFINSAGGSRTWLGGEGQSGGYSLDASEFARVFADRSISVTAGQSVQPGDMVVDTLGVAFGPSGQIGTDGSLNLSSPGRIMVIGPLSLQTSSAADSLRIAANRLDVVTDTGGIGLADSTGKALGSLVVNADRVVVASSAAIAAFDQAADMAAINTIMDTPPAATPAGNVSAGSIAVTVGDGIYVQNTGISTDYADRRGFSAGSLAITTGSRATRIVINGITFDANGQPVTGLDTLKTIAITGTYAAGSTVNGCTIGTNCGQVIETPILTKGDLQGAVDPDDTPTAPLAQIEVAPITVDVPEFQRGENLPLVDDPVTGIGNEDLWGANCPPGAQGCAGGGEQ